MPPVVISPEELAANLENVVLLDARTGANPAGSFASSHLPGARFADLDHDLADVGDPRIGGRHPLPTPARFAGVLGALGVKPEDEVVVYDMAGGINAASRLWWMLRAAGHQKVRVLDAKPELFAPAGLILNADTSQHQPAPPYPFENWQLPTVDRDFVKTVQFDPTWTIIDVRSAPRFRGETEPIDPVAGHIPGARNLFHLELAGPDGKLLDPEAIAARFNDTVGDIPLDHVIVHCGSGVTACHAILAFEHAGIGIPAIYTGSWSEWCRNEPLLK